MSDPLSELAMAAQQRASKTTPNAPTTIAYQSAKIQSAERNHRGIPHTEISRGFQFGLGFFSAGIVVIIGASILLTILTLLGLRAMIFKVTGI